MAAPPAGAAARQTDTITVTEVAGTTPQQWVFGEVDASYAAGKYEFTLDNTTAAPHEFVVFKLTDAGALLTIDQLRAAADVGADGVVEKFTGAVFAPPGTEDAAKFKLKRPGEYAFFCFIAPENSTDPALAHYNRGLIGTFDVN